MAVYICYSCQRKNRDETYLSFAITTNVSMILSKQQELIERCSKIILRMFQINILVGSILSVRGPILLFSNQPFHLDFKFEGKQVFLAIFGVADSDPF